MLAGCRRCFCWTCSSQSSSFPILCSLLSSFKNFSIRGQQGFRHHTAQTQKVLLLDTLRSVLLLLLLFLGPTCTHQVLHNPATQIQKCYGWTCSGQSSSVPFLSLLLQVLFLPALARFSAIMLPRYPPSYCPDTEGNTAGHAQTSLPSFLSSVTSSSPSRAFPTSTHQVLHHHRAGAAGLLRGHVHHLRGHTRPAP